MIKTYKSSLYLSRSSGSLQVLLRRIWRFRVRFCGRLVELGRFSLGNISRFKIVCSSRVYVTSRSIGTVEMPTWISNPLVTKYARSNRTSFGRWTTRKVFNFKRIETARSYGIFGFRCGFNETSQTGVHTSQGSFELRSDFWTRRDDSRDKTIAQKEKETGKTEVTMQLIIFQSNKPVLVKIVKRNFFRWKNW